MRDGSVIRASCQGFELFPISANVESTAQMVDGGASGGAYGGDAGNYKGVMLCNRPSDSSPAGGPEIKPEMNAPQFRPGGLPAEQIGLNPPRDNRMTNVKLAHDEHDRLVAARPEGPTNFLSKHRKWLAEIAKKKKAVHAELEASLAAQATRNKKFVAYSSTLRDAVRGRQAELAADGLPHAQPDLDRSAAASASAAPAAAAPAAPVGGDDDAVIPARPPTRRGSSGADAVSSFEALEVEDAEDDATHATSGTADTGVRAVAPSPRVHPNG